MSVMEEAFLAKARQSGVEVHLFLITGVKLNGVIEDFSDTSLLLSGRGNTQLVYRHSIATVLPVGN